MIAEPYSASLVSRLPIAEKQHIPQTYYRSKLFIATSATNPLVAAASPLLSLMERLCISPTLPPIDQIRDNIEHELYAFHGRLLGQDYAEELVAVAQYLLSATIDELLGKNYVRLYGQPAEFKAFTPSSHEDIGPQRRFFDIVYHIKERATQYLDLLELAYYCLIAGFEGEQHLRPDGRHVLDNLIEELYQLIQQHRVSKPHRLFREQTPSMPEPINHKPFVTGILLAAGILTIVYLASHTLLEYKAKTVLYEHTVLANMDS
ncbi:type IVB secretion system protein IcmH/DotU [Legionella oakridgensis]|uniref:Dot/Icm secretion system protein ImcH n=2 Tax=Legionella oakridgensis TaxID=29423 RepID=W0BGZ5_9GAMM|nr:type IVB secretion system protein IcmH/DotU [Legionella oakridgensis]AHE67892.1 Dot/Icm secretion system protein ImcH [Legionella oakridgensis ATCC 33761 = DSM 21215]ETO92525.1 type IV / VI secretion system protein, DotU family [Legionella oakridgensis RV-2-2007]KTD38712.1 IcmH (DotU) [Legionella oakridgensis]STY20897.1 IcmH (DotU) [Legionella longbeachae]